MTTKLSLTRCRTSPAHVIVIVWSALMISSLTGCSRSTQPRPTSERNVEAGGESITSRDSHWPSLFGEDRTSVYRRTLNLTWSDEGPPLLWETPVGTGYGSPVTGDGSVIFNSRVDDSEFVQCLDVATGDERWQHRYPTTAVCEFKYSDGPYSTPVIDVDRRRVFNVGGQGQIMCLDLDDGHVIWSRNLHQEYGVEADIFPVGASPLLIDAPDRPKGQLLFGLGAIDRNAGIVSLDAETGETIWQSTDQGPSYGTPLVTELHGERFAFALTDEGVVCLHPDTGEVDWTYPFRRRGDLVRNATSPLVWRDRLILVSTALGVVSLQIHPDRTQTLDWRQRRVLDSQYNTLILAEDHLYSFTSAGQNGAEFRCVDLRDGKLCWKYNSPLKRGMGLATDRAFILLGERGHLASLERRTDKAQVISFTEKPLMREPCYCSPAVYENTLILKDETRVAAFDLSPAK